MSLDPFDRQILENSPYVGRGRWSSVTWIVVIIKFCSNVMLSRFVFLSKRLDDLSEMISWSVLNCSGSHD
jgi:hypothetical protein